MYAIIEAAGKQFRVEKGMTISLDRQTNETGGDIEFSQVLLVKPDEGGASKIGTPYVEGSKVLGTVVKHFRGSKIVVFKKRSKKGYKKTQGHRQNLTEVQIKEVIA